jgi:AcrR family transcriptional regulator
MSPASQSKQGTAPNFRDRIHELLRTSILDAAAAAATTTDWPSVRLADIATSVGVSRQTVYNEFGTKEDLAKALFAREEQVLSAGLVAAISAAPTLPDAIRDSLTWLLAEAQGNPILQRILIDARAANSEASMLPLLTVRADSFARPLGLLLMAEFGRRWPANDKNRAALAVDFVIRWALSQIVAPTGFDQAEAIDRLAEMIEFMLRPAFADSAARSSV